MKALLALTLVALTGCAQTVAVIKSDPELTKVTREDAQRAKELAINGGDTVAAECWDSIVRHLPDTPDQDMSTVGPLSNFQKIRLARLKADEGISDETKQKCSVLIVEAVGTTRGLVQKILTIAP